MLWLPVEVLLLVEASPAWALPLGTPGWQWSVLVEPWAGQTPWRVPWAGPGVTLGSGWWHRDAGTAKTHPGVREVWSGGEVGALK